MEKEDRERRRQLVKEMNVLSNAEEIIEIIKASRSKAKRRRKARVKNEEEIPTRSRR